MTANKITVLIPAYNEEKTIHSLVKQVLQYTSSIIVIDDGSSDGTRQALAGLPVSIVANKKNKGKGASLFRGLQILADSHCDAVITIDADGQHDPADIQRFIKAHQQYPKNLIIGARLKQTKNAPTHRYIANKIADFFISWAAGLAISDTQSGYRLYPASLLKDCLAQKLTSAKFGFESDLLINSCRAKYTPVALPISSHYPTDARPSHYKNFDDTFDIFKLVSKKIVTRFFYPRGLFNAIFQKAAVIDEGESPKKLAE